MLYHIGIDDTLEDGIFDFETRFGSLPGDISEFNHFAKTRAATYVFFVNSDSYKDLIEKIGFKSK